MPSLSSIRIEGGLLGPDILDQLLAGELPGQRASDFGLSDSRNLTDEIASIFADARALWGIFQNRLAKLRDEDPATTITRDAWAIPFLSLLGYSPTYNARAYDVDGLSFAVSHRAGDDPAAPPVHIVGARQELGRLSASGRPRMAPHSLLQEYLNRTENLWGVVTNGVTIRLLRDCTFVRRQAYVEFDLPSILAEQKFQDFSALYRLLHRSRLPRGPGDSSCFIERYYTQSVEQGGRVREHLRDGVEECIRQMANGFLKHAANTELRQRVSPDNVAGDRLTAEDLYRELLTLVYRLLFLLVSEDRGLLSANPLYHQHYGIARLRRMLDQRGAYSEDDDVWQSLRVLWQLMTKDQPQPSLNNQPMAAAIGLPVLNGDLFAAQVLDACTIANRDLLNGFWHLAQYTDPASRISRRVNYGALDVEELGSVYESLLELHPVLQPLDTVGWSFDFVKGGGRKETGSYYTPPQLVNELIRSALDPVIAARLAADVKNHERALLSIRVCDPACGSGHFLLAAARRLSRELARIRSGDDEPAPERIREAVRDVVAHCIYGVDRNPLAVDLCRVALWLDSHTADKPLTFLDHRIRCGDSLVGVFDLQCLKEGIPDAAFKPLEGDDKATASALAKRNKQERGGARDLFADRTPVSLDEFTQDSRALASIPDDSPSSIREKKRRFEQSHANPGWRQRKEMCDLWTAAFFQPLRPNVPAITSAALSDRGANRPVDPRVLGQAMRLSHVQRFFHWPLEFPEVFADGGFDVILSNPPWERVKLQEQEFFGARDPRIATAPNKAARGKLIKDLLHSNPALHAEFTEAQRAASGVSSLMRESGRYPLTGRGDINTYAVFAELATTSINRFGRAGMIVPTGIATDDTTKHFFGSLVNNQQLVNLIGFENEQFIFPAVHHAFKFCSLTLTGQSAPAASSRIAFFIRSFDQLSEEQRFFSLEKQDFELLNPNTGNCPIFRTQADAELTKAIYRRVPILWREAREDQPEVNPWRLRFKTMFHLSNDSHHFRTADELRTDGYRLEGNVFVSPYDRYLPLYEAKMLHQFDHRFSTYEGATEKQLNVGILPQPTPEVKRDPAFVVQPRYWIREEVVESAIPRYPEPLAQALTTGHRPSLQRVLCLWGAGFHFEQGDSQTAGQLVYASRAYDIDNSVARFLNFENPEQVGRELQHLFPLTGSDALAIAEQLLDPEDLAQELMRRFSPRWLMGWRDITNAGNERTLLVSIAPLSGVGNSYPLFFTTRLRNTSFLAFEAIANSYIVDYAARQKVGGTHINYFYIKQFPFLRPDDLDAPPRFDTSTSLVEWIMWRVLELSYTTNDLTPLARTVGCAGPPFAWNEHRRFEIRCELDAAMFHLYLPADNSGDWKTVDSESLQNLDSLRTHFPTPRDALGFILDQFPITRQTDEKAHGRYRTRDRILEIYDAMLVAQRTNTRFQTTLDPPPGRGT